LVEVMFSGVDNITSLLLYKFETVKDVKWHFLDTSTFFISMNIFTHRHSVFFLWTCCSLAGKISTNFCDNHHKVSMKL
jgi:hypothetical protein